MSIPISFSVDIVGKAVLKDEAMLEMLKVVEGKDNLFASSPIGATMQDGGKRKRSTLTEILLISTNKISISFYVSSQSTILMTFLMRIDKSTKW